MVDCYRDTNGVVHPIRKSTGYRGSTAKATDKPSRPAPAAPKAAKGRKRREAPFVTAHREQEQRRKAEAAAERASATYGVFPHTDASGHRTGRGYVVRQLPAAAPYGRQRPVKTYKSRSAADKDADRRS